MAALLAAVIVLAAAPPGAEKGGVLVVRGAPEQAGTEQAFIEALRIYTRDLARRVSVRPGAPRSLNRAELDRAGELARRDGAQLVVWLRRSGGSLRLFALRVRESELRRTTADDDGDLVAAATTLALKVRALLARAPALEAQWTSIPAPSPLPPPAPAPAVVVAELPAPTPRRHEAPPTPPAPVKAPAPPTVDAAPEDPPPEVGATASLIGLAVAEVSRDALASRALPQLAPLAAPARRSGWVELAAAYSVTGVADPAWRRQGLSLRVTALPLDLPIAFGAELALSPAVTSSVGASVVSLSDLPFGGGAQYRYRRGRLGLAAGPWLRLHALSATGSAADGRAATTHRFAFGAGVLGEARWTLAPRLDALLAADVEALFPRQRFTVDGAVAGDLGFADLQLVAGLSVALP